MELTIKERFLVLTHHPEKARFIISDLHLNYGLIGAIFLEMSLINKIVIENGKLLMNDKIVSSDYVHSLVSQEISKSKRQRKLKDWVIKLSRKSRIYKWLILDELSNSNLIKIEHRRFLGLIPYKKVLLTDTRKRDVLISKLNRGVVYGKELTNEDMVVLGLIEACKMHKVISTNKEELRIIKKELKRIIKESPIATSVDKTIKEVQAAIITAVTVAAISSAASSH